MAWKLFIFVALFISSVISNVIPDGTPELPIWDKLEIANSKYDVNGYPLWEGDIMLGDYKERNARKNLDSRWPNGQIPYKLDVTMYRAQKQIEQGMKLWSDNTCVNFVNSPTIRNKPHLVIKHTGTGCNSWVGIFNKYTTDQTVSLDYPGCATSVSVVTHELGHAIGLWHEQDRLDRDQYLKVYKKNMGNNSIYFETSGSDVMHYDVPYEYESVMQYSSSAFSVNKRLTLVPRDPMKEVVMGTYDLPTYLDYKIVNRMYNCSDGCGSRLPDCGEGYATWNEAKGCRCECPKGFYGEACEQVVWSDSLCGGKITREQRLTSVNYPNDYPANLKCSWLIEAPVGKVPTVFFHEFQLLGRAGNDNLCYWDVFKIRKDDLLSDEPGDTYCGQELKNREIRSNSRQLLVSFTTRYEHSPGFDLSIKFV